MLRPARRGQGTPLIIPLTRQPTSSCARRGELAPALPTGRICRTCTAAVQVTIEPVPAPNGGSRAIAAASDHAARPAFQSVSEPSADSVLEGRQLQMSRKASISAILVC
jgi:hypothetical protein